MKLILNIAKALSDANRLQALMLLKNGEMCVCQLIENLQLAPSTVSKHMSILKQAELVAARRAGKWTYYRLPDADSNPAATEIIRWLVVHLENDLTVKKDKVCFNETDSDKIEPCCKKC